MVNDNHDNQDNITIDEIAKRRAAFPGATIKLSELQRQDGLINDAIDRMGAQKQGVIQTFIQAIDNDKNYRQILKNARWKSTEEQDKAIIALACCYMTGATWGTKLILDRLTARSSGIDGASMHEAYEALMHTKFTSEHFDYSGKRKNGKDSSSPIA